MGSVARALARDGRLACAPIVMPAAGGARPMGMSLNLQPSETALVLIDLQQGIVARDVAPHASADVVKRCSALADAMRKAGGTVVYVHVLVNEMLRLPADRAANRPPAPPEAVDLVPEAGFQPGTDILITKRQWGAFHATDLDQQLRRRGIRTVILGGIATNLGVESTARSAQEHGYSLVFAEDAMSSLGAEMHKFSVETMFPMMGRVRRTDEILADLTAASGQGQAKV